MGHYAFTDEWRVAADPERVWEVVRDVGAWPQWWPASRSVVTVVPGDDHGLGAVRRFTFGTRLPYDMIFDARLLRDDPADGVEAAITGRVEGTGRWEVRPVTGGTLVRFEWLVRPRLRWMRLLSPIARPVFIWNHRALMSEGGDALARRLRTGLLTPSTSTPALMPAVVAAVGIGALALGSLMALTLIVRRGRSASP